MIRMRVQNYQNGKTILANIAFIDAPLSCIPSLIDRAANLLTPGNTGLTRFDLIFFSGAATVFVENGQ
jgi:hypothetical protein